ncbi:MAG TPA: histidine ammonia-lyase, partial [Candidatus Xenobia bacterium]
MIVLDHPLNLGEVVQVARHRVPLSLGPETVARIQASRRMLEELIAGGVAMYGVTTGVGELSKVRVGPEHASTLSANIVMSHACGVGEPLRDEQVRAIMVCAVLNWSQGRSGVRLALAQRLVDLLNHDVVPYVPSQGGMGSLTHMAHIGLVAMGLGEVLGRRPAAERLADAGLAPLALAEKEGLSLVNGTVSKTGLASLALHDARRLAVWADVAGAMSFEALKGVPTAFDPRIHAARPHPGQSHVARNLLALIADSEIVAKYRHERVQDALSLRCMPQVHGAIRDQIEAASHTCEIEMNSATDNPLLFDGQALSGCNAHGEPMALSTDALAMAVADLANISERRIDRLVNHHVSDLPAFLVRGNGLSSGFMIPQYVAAALVAENKVLGHPMSVDSIPTTALQEDHWSMGTGSALKAGRVVHNAQKVVAIEVLTAAQALEFHRPLLPGQGTRAMQAEVRQHIPPWDEDRIFYPDMEKVIFAVETDT